MMSVVRSYSITLKQETTASFGCFAAATSPFDCGSDSESELDNGRFGIELEALGLKNWEIDGVFEAEQHSFV